MDTKLGLFIRRLKIVRRHWSAISARAWRAGRGLNTIPIIVVLLSSTACVEPTAPTGFIGNRNPPPAAAAVVEETVVLDDSALANLDQSTACLKRLDGEACSEPASMVDSGYHLVTQFFRTTAGSLRQLVSFVDARASVLTATQLPLAVPTLVYDTDPAPTPVAAGKSVRSHSLAVLPSGGVLSLFNVTTELGVAATPAHEVLYRRPYVDILDPVLGTWSGSQVLGRSDYVTDMGIDYGAGGTGQLTTQCQPRATVASNGVAMMAWCEDDDVTTDTDPAEIMYRTYASGTFSPTLVNPPTQLVTASTLSDPGFSGRYMVFEPFGGRTVTTYFQVGDTVTSTFTDSASALPFIFRSYQATVSAVSENATDGQFLIRYSSNGAVDVCETLREALQALLRVPASCATQAGVCDAKSLSELNVSARLSSSCGTDSSTWAFALFFNQSLGPEKRVLSAVDTYKKITAFTIATQTQLGASSQDFSNTISTRNANALDLEADGTGRIYMVRNEVSPYLKSNAINSSMLGYGRRLVGHIYNAVTGEWLKDSENNLWKKPLSRTPFCNQNGTQVACSARNPKIIMSPSGHGLVFYHQNQINPHTNTATVNYPRLHVARVSTLDGYYSQGAILDTDTVCSSSSLRNDKPVCETGDFTDACQTYGASTARAASATNGEPVSADYYALNGIGTTSEIMPIAAAINTSGAAVVAYHKTRFTGTIAVPACSGVGTFVTFYDPVNGFSSIVEVDSTLTSASQSMSVQVAINDNNLAAVVFETIYSATQKLVHLAVYRSGTQVAFYTVNDSAALQNPDDPSKPSVIINSSNQIIVTYANDQGGDRKMYQRKYQL